MHKLLTTILVLSCSVTFAKNTECQEELKNKKITLQVPFKAGGSFDLTARAIAEPLKEITKAKVSIQNNPSLSGLYSINAIKGSNSKDIHLGVFSARNLIELSHSKKINWQYEFTSLTTYLSEETFWLTRKKNGADISKVQEIIIAGSKNDDLEAKAIAKLIGKSYRLISGYTGSSDYANATLRNEVDFFGPSKFTANRFIKSGDYVPALIISNSPDSQHTQTPYLGDPKGLIKKSDYSPKTSSKIAKEIINISRSDRIIFTSRHLPRVTLECLAESIRSSIQSQSFTNKVEKLQLDIFLENSDKSNIRLLEIEKSLIFIRDFVND